MHASHRRDTRKQRLFGFTLLELMIVISIMGILATLITGNFLTSLAKGRDAKRKTDLGNIAKSLELYYEDHRQYPLSITFGGPLCETDTCETGEQRYMQQVPLDPKGSNNYEYMSDGTHYRLFACIENNNDLGSGVVQDGIPGTDCGACPSGASVECTYGIASANTTIQ